MLDDYISRNVTLGPFVFSFFLSLNLGDYSVLSIHQTLVNVLRSPHTSDISKPKVNH